MSFQEMHQMYNEVHGVEEDPRFKKMVKFEEEVLELLNQFRQGKALNTEMDEEKQPLEKLAPGHEVSSVVFGIQNIGNTCFFNSTLQALNATRELVSCYAEFAKNRYFGSEDILKISHPRPGMKYLNLSYVKFLQDGYSGKTGSSIHPSHVHTGICAINRKYRSRNQEDAPELFRYFIDGLIEGEHLVLKEKDLLNKDPKIPFKKKEGTTEQVFCTYQAHRVTCLHCAYISWTYHLSVDLDLDVDKESLRQSRHNLVEEKKEARAILDKRDKELKERVEKGHFELTDDMWNQAEDPIPNFKPDEDRIFAPVANLLFSEDSQSQDLEDLLDNFFRREVLNNVENYYTCYGCNKKRGEPKKNEVRFITKTFFLYDPSPVIVITLKRFKKQQSNSSYYSMFGGSGSFTKIDTQVKFPAKLSLTKYFMSRPR
jgi:ubiquitin carboxyl-terminal hydrolase 16/45